MDSFTGLAEGFAQALTPTALLFAFIGVLIGTVVGVLPGIGPITAIALLIPLSFGLEPVHGLIMLCAIYYGAMYGGSITATLIRTPGEVASVVTTIDGYEMARQGRAGPALATAAVGSFLAGTLALVGLMLLSPLLVEVAVAFGAAEYFLLMLLALMMCSTLTTASRLKTGLAILFGLAVGVIGLDPQTGAPRRHSASSRSTTAWTSRSSRWPCSPCPRPSRTCADAVDTNARRRSRAACGCPARTGAARPVRMPAGRCWGS